MTMHEQAATNLRNKAAELRKLYKRELITEQEATLIFGGYYKALEELQLIGAGYALNAAEAFKRELNVVYVYDAIKAEKTRFFSIWNTIDDTCEFAGNYDDYMEEANTGYWDKCEVTKRIEQDNGTIILEIH